jgi:hypothetical protein
MRFITYGGSASSIALLVMACPSVLGGKTSFVTTIICYSNSFNYAVNGITIFSSARLFLKNNTSAITKTVPLPAASNERQCHQDLA